MAKVCCWTDERWWVENDETLIWSYVSNLIAKKTFGCRHWQVYQHDCASRHDRDGLIWTSSSYAHVVPTLISTRDCERVKSLRWLPLPAEVFLDEKNVVDGACWDFWVAHDFRPSLPLHCRHWNAGRCSSHCSLRLEHDGSLSYGVESSSSILNATYLPRIRGELLAFLGR